MWARLLTPVLFTTHLLSREQSHIGWESISLSPNQLARTKTHLPAAGEEGKPAVCALAAGAPTATARRRMPARLISTVVPCLETHPAALNTEKVFISALFVTP